MIRTTFALFFVVASATAGHANGPSAQQEITSAQQPAYRTMECFPKTDGQPFCSVREVSRGHAVLAPRFIVPASQDRVLTA